MVSPDHVRGYRMIKTGDLFAIPVRELGFVTGHAVLVVDDPATSRKLGKTSRLRERGALLVDVYGPATPAPSPDSAAMLVHGVWTDSDPLERRRSRWNVIGHRAVDPTAVEFPEWVINSGRGPRFERGEISRPLAIEPSEVDRIDCRRPFIALAALASICVNVLGRGDLLGEDRILFALDAEIDLRYSEHRSRIYQLLGEDPARTYWDWATADRFDPGRLWS